MPAISAFLLSALELFQHTDLCSRPGVTRQPLPTALVRSTLFVGLVGRRWMVSGRDAALFHCGGGGGDGLKSSAEARACIRACRAGAVQLASRSSNVVQAPLQSVAVSQSVRYIAEKIPRRRRRRRVHSRACQPASTHSRNKHSASRQAQLPNHGTGVTDRLQAGPCMS